MSSTALGVPPSTSQPSPAELVPGTRAFKLLFAGLVITLFLSALDNTIVATAMPTIVGDLGGFKRYTWATTSYVVASTISTLVLGKLSDLYGRRKVYLITIVVFLVTSAMCGLAQSMEQLIAFRTLQGLGGGGIWSLTFAVVGDVVSPRERGRYFGLFTSVFAFASLAGPLLGGLIVGNMSWRWIFYVNLPIGALSIFMVLRTLHLPSVARTVRLDWVGALLVSGFIVGFMIALEVGAESGWASIWVIGLFVAAAVLLAAYVRQELRFDEPITPPRLFQNEVVRTSLVFGFLTGSVMMTVGLFFSLYLQNVRLLEPQDAGLRTLPLMIGMTLASTGTGRYISSSGHYRRTALIGLPIAATGLLIGGLTMLRSAVDSTVSLWLLSLSLLIVGTGMGMTFPTASISIQNSADPRDLGIATSTGNFFRNLGSAIGLAIFGSIFNAIVRSNLESNLPERARSGDVFSVIRTPEKVRALPDDVREAVTSSIAAGSSRVVLIAVGMALLTTVVAWKLKEEPLRSGPDRAAAPAAD
jgi:EmrB/QacA subfamily drug resistance transporter